VGSIDVDLLLLLLLVVAFDVPQLGAGVVPINDSFYNFANFHVFYRELLFHGTRAAWLPYEGFGIQSDYEQLIALGPASYLVGAIGWLVGATDVLLLYKLAMVLEQCAFVFGVYLLARRLFASPATRWALCVAAAGTTVWYAQEWWDLRIFYLLPLVLHFLLRFFAERRPELLWVAGLVGVAWSIGNLPYLIPLWVLVLVAIAAIAAGRDWRALRSLATPTARNAVLFALFAIAAGVYVWLAAHALDGAILRASNRDPLTGEVKAEVFKSYGGKGNFVIVLNALLFGWPVHLPWGSWSDNSAYLGLLPLVGLSIALVRERRREFLAFVTAAVMLGWLSFGGVGAALAWHLPGLSYFRHVGLVFGLVKVLLLVASGFGLERLWTLAPPRLSHPIFLLVAAIVSIEAFAALPQLPAMTAHGWVIEWGQHVLVRLLVYGAAVALCRFGSWRLLGAALAFALAIDLATYQVAVFDRVSKVGPAVARAALRPRAPVWRDERIALPADPAEAAKRLDDPQSRAAFALATRPEMKETYAYVYQFADIDPCRDHYRNDAHLAGVDALIALERGGVAIDGVTGCGAPKLALAPGARVVASRAEAAAALAAALRQGESHPVLVQAPPDVAPVAGADPPAGGSVRVTDFTLGALAADVEVAAPGGAWLVYADAFHPAWRASVDGVETPVRPANLAFKAIRVPAGHSVVRLWFDGSWRGSALAAVGLACAAAWLAAALAVAFGRR
jgi:hypothetical protein